jgi:hypothetical protein
LSTLHHVLDLEWMREAYRLTRKDGAPGIDGVTYERRRRGHALPGDGAHLPIAITVRAPERREQVAVVSAQPVLGGRLLRAGFDIIDFVRLSSRHQLPSRVRGEAAMSPAKQPQTAIGAPKLTVASRP